MGHPGDLRIAFSMSGIALAWTSCRVIIPSVVFFLATGIVFSAPLCAIATAGKAQASRSFDDRGWLRLWNELTYFRSMFDPNRALLKKSDDTVVLCYFDFAMSQIQRHPAIGRAIGCDCECMVTISDNERPPQVLQPIELLRVYHRIDDELEEKPFLVEYFFCRNGTFNDWDPFLK